MGGGRHQLVAQDSGGAKRGAAAHGHPAAGDRADRAERRRRRIAADHDHIPLGIDAQPRRADLGNGRLDPLPLRREARVDNGPAGGVHPHLHRLEAAEPHPSADGGP